MKKSKQSLFVAIDDSDDTNPRLISIGSHDRVTDGIEDYASGREWDEDDIMVNIHVYVLGEDLPLVVSPKGYQVDF